MAFAFDVHVPDSALGVGVQSRSSRAIAGIPGIRHYCFLAALSKLREAFVQVARLAVGFHVHIPAVSIGEEGKCYFPNLLSIAEIGRASCRERV